MRQNHPRKHPADLNDAAARRRWLRRSLALIAVGATAGAGLGAAILFNAKANEAAAPLTAFMTVSHMLTGKAALDQAVGARLFAALQASVPYFSQRIRQLADALPADLSPAAAAGTTKIKTNLKADLKENLKLTAVNSDLNLDLNSDPQQALASAIMRGWYLGLVDSTVVAYEQALMYTAVADTLPVRSYCGGAPGFWAEQPMES